MQIGSLLSSKMDGLRRGTWGMSKRNAAQLDFVLTPLHPLLHTFPIFWLSVIGLPCLCQLYLQIRPNEICPTVVHPSFPIYGSFVLWVPSVFSPLPLCLFQQKDVLIGGQCFALIIRKGAYSAAEGFPLSKFLFLHYQPVVIYNITLIRRAKSMNLKLTRSATIFPR